MTSSTSTIPLSRRHELSSTAALLLTIGGNILVIAIGALAVAGVGIAAIAVFGAGLFDAL